MFPPYFYFRFSRNQLFLASREQMKGPALPARTRVLLSPTGFAFRPFCHQKFFGPRHSLSRCLSTKAEPKHQLGPVGLAFQASQMPPLFRPFDVCLALSDVLRSTPTTPNVFPSFVEGQLGPILVLKAGKQFQALCDVYRYFRS